MANFRNSIRIKTVFGISSIFFLLGLIFIYSSKNILFLPVILGLGIILTVVFLEYTLIRPIEKLSGFASVINDNPKEVNKRLSPASNDEIGQLAYSFNCILEKIEEHNNSLELNIKEKILKLRNIQDQMIHCERMMVLGSLAYGVAHELNNPLTVILGNAQIMRGEIGADNDWSHDLIVIEEAVKRCQKIIDNMVDFACQKQFSLELVQVNELIDTTLNLCRSKIQAEGIKVVKQYQQNLPMVPVSKADMQQVLVNIIMNAQQSMSHGGVLTAATVLQGEKVALSFADNGMGIKKEHLPKIFEPFFTTKEVGKGTGLGLSVSLRIVRAHGGDIKVETAGEGKGSTFTVTLPVKQGV